VNTTVDEWLSLEESNLYDLVSARGCLSEYAANTPSCAALNAITNAAIYCRIFVSLAVLSLVWPVIQVMDLQGTRTWRGEVGDNEELESYMNKYRANSVVGFAFLGTTLVLWPVALNQALNLMMKEFKLSRAITQSTDTVAVRPGGSYWLTLMSTLMAIAVLNGSCIPWRHCPTFLLFCSKRRSQRTGEATPLFNEKLPQC